MEVFAVLSVAPQIVHLVPLVSVEFRPSVRKSLPSVTMVVSGLVHPPSNPITSTVPVIPHHLTVTGLSTLADPSYGFALYCKRGSATLIISMHHHGR